MSCKIPPIPPANYISVYRVKAENQISQIKSWGGGIDILILSKILFPLYNTHDKGEVHH